MTGARQRALLLLVAAIMLVAALAFAAARRSALPLAPRPPAERPALLLLTSLPLIFSEDFSLRASGSGVFKKLRTRYRVIPISVADGAELAKGRLLLMAQPQAQTAGEPRSARFLGARGGGRLLLAIRCWNGRASGRSGTHCGRRQCSWTRDCWGTGAAAGPSRRARAVMRELGGFEVMAVSPGALRVAAGSAATGLSAHCRHRQGTGDIVADADFLGPTASANWRAQCRWLARGACRARVRAIRSKSQTYPQACKPEQAGTACPNDPSKSRRNPRVDH